MTLALMLMAAVARMFAQLGSSINNSRATLESADHLRAAATRLQMDLDGVTATMLPPRRVESNEGYFEYIEGSSLAATPWDTSAGTLDTTVGQMGDILMFTTRSANRPFTGQLVTSSGTATIQSDTAEVAWFVRGRTLHRRVLLVAPTVQLANNSPSGTFYQANDISVHLQGNVQTGILVPNSLGDLTRRECRFAHPYQNFPYNVCAWGQLGLPTLYECSVLPWSACNTPTGAPPSLTQVDLWSNANGSFLADSALFSSPPTAPPAAPPAGARVADDVILTNVIGFDVKVWDPGAGDYVDLGATNAVTFSTANINPKSPAGGTLYDTWSTHYESVGIGNGAVVAGRASPANNGFDDSSSGVVDSPADAITGAPFPYALRGIRIKIRVFEPDSRNVREVTVIQDFLPK